MEPFCSGSCEQGNEIQGYTKTVESAPWSWYSVDVIVGFFSLTQY
jgi:hypothetical protein